MSSLDYLDLCRLCLVKDRVSVPIFEGEGDVRQIFLKITACLPVKVNREDKLPKKICDDCVYKVELCYQFWHTTANAEKQLLQWLGEVNMEDKQGYNVLNPNGVKADQSNENRLDGTVMQQVSEHQNNMNMNMMDNMSLSMPMMMSSNTQQQITSVPMDNSGSSVQNVQPVAGPSTQTTHDQITQNQTDAPTQQEEEEESSDEDENSDDECDGDEGLPIKEESEEDPMSNRTIEPTTFVNVSLACDEPGPSGLQQQKITDMPEIVIPQTSDVDPKTGKMKKKGNWNEENMKEALKQITEKKMTQKQAAETFHVPKTTLGDRYRALQIGETVTFTPQMGRFKMTFDKELEAQLVSYIKDLDKKFMPFSRSEFLKFSYDLAEHLKLKHRFNKEIKTAGKRFYYDFMARNPSLSLRSPESTSLQKALGFDRHQVDRFFNRYSELLMKYNFSANKIHNCDETGVPIVHDNIIKVISQKGKKQVSKITSAERGRNVTVLLSINAAGNIFVPPLFVYPKQRVDAILKKDAPPGSIFTAEESGWITAKAFLKWLELFVERTQPTEKEPVLLIVDGHASHKNLDVILFAKQHHVHMLSLLPHTTHKLQPLDRAVMQPFKAAYNQACSIWMRKFQPLKITLRDIAALVNTAYISICRMDLAQSAFECTGLWPFNPAIFTDLDFIPSEHFQQPESVATPVIYLPEFQEPSTSFVSEPTNINILFQSSPADEPSHFMEICPTDECSNLMEIVKIISPTANIEEMRKKKKQRKN